MGWKNVKEGYQIGHAVCVTRDGICIGSPYIHNIMVVGLDGIVKKRYEDKRTNEDLWRYQREMDAAPEKLKALVLSPDSFSAARVVYTYAGGEIIEKFCEQYGWPNVTHDGCMMYDNTFSDDKEKVVQWAKTNVFYGIKSARERIKEIHENLTKAEAWLAHETADHIRLENDYPRV